MQGDSGTLLVCPPDDEWAGTECLRGVIEIRCAVVDDAGASRQRAQQCRVRLTQRQHHCMSVVCGHGGDVPEALVAYVFLADDLVERPDDIVGVERVTVGKCRVAAQMESHGPPVLGRGPAVGERGDEFVVLIASDKRFVDVAEQGLFDGGALFGADIQ